MRLAHNIRKQLKEIVNDNRFQQFVASQQQQGGKKQGSSSISSNSSSSGSNDAAKGLFEFRAKSKNIRKAVCAGFFMLAARNCQQATYRTVDYGCVMFVLLGSRRVHSLYL